MDSEFDDDVDDIPILDSDSDSSKKKKSSSWGIIMPRPISFLGQYVLLCLDYAVFSYSCQLLRIYKSKTMSGYNISDSEELSSTPPDIREKATNATKIK
ncbi:hypothetical protein NQ318_021274 [Aromia moschata]|uniref:Uncharacterized protein n=1 Tax=Aromia moschata TaxID=1265417 RepID=A0AAV8ZDC1_9CUCU|nr:hypothetical protein NQ318_021274 [Aromia moschata]